MALFCHMSQGFPYPGFSAKAQREQSAWELRGLPMALSVLKMQLEIFVYAGNSIKFHELLGFCDF